MSEFVIKKLKGLPLLVKPVLIEGLPGIGNVARLTVDYLIDKLKAVKFMELYSDVFPNSVTVTDESLIKMFNVEFMHARLGDRDLIFVAGDVQPTSDAESYALCKKIIELCREWKIKEVITLGGIGLPEVPEKVKVHAVLNNINKFKEKLKESQVILDGNDTVKIIIGAAGLLLGIARLEGIDGFSLLAETLNQPQHVGMKESRQVIKVLSKYLNFEIDFKSLDEDIKSYEDDLKEESKTSKNEPVQRHGYIG